MQNIKLSCTSPQFLHGNATSHIWVFSAVAELVDNAYDPDVSSSKLFIDKKEIGQGHNAEVCLTFTDNGNGMRPEKLHRMLSFGFCEKVEVRGVKPVGHYGNGFKSGSMRLGTDALVFTKRPDTMSVGFLSQTFLKEIKADSVLVPIVSFDSKTKQMLPGDDNKDSLKAILKYSIYDNREKLVNEFGALDDYRSGTRIIIYNLKRTTSGKFELDFDSDPHDIINSESLEVDSGTTVRPVREYMPKFRNSLREYCSILYLKPRMAIYIRGKKVNCKLVAKSLNETEKDVYKPGYLKDKLLITFGFSSTQDFGLMMYHRNRLIKAYERVMCQRQADGRGANVVGIVQVDFLEPIHNKQDFNKDDRYNTFMSALNQKLMDYWYAKTQKDRPNPSEGRRPDWTWAQCDQCLKWRRMVDDVTNKDLPEKWFCRMNTDPLHNRCDVPEEPEDEDEIFRATYRKTKGNTKEKDRRQSMHVNTSNQQNNSTDLTLIQKMQQELEQAREKELQHKAEIEKLKKTISNKLPHLTQQYNDATPKKRHLPSASTEVSKRARTVLQLDNGVSVEENSHSDDDDCVVTGVERRTKHSKGHMPAIVLGSCFTVGDEQDDIKPDLEELEEMISLTKANAERQAPPPAVRKPPTAGRAATATASKAPPTTVGRAPPTTAVARKKTGGRPTAAVQPSAEVYMDLAEGGGARAVELLGPRITSSRVEELDGVTISIVSRPSVSNKAERARGETSAAAGGSGSDTGRMATSHTVVSDNRVGSSDSAGSGEGNTTGTDEQSLLTQAEFHPAKPDESTQGDVNPSCSLPEEVAPGKKGKKAKKQSTAADGCGHEGEIEALSESLFKLRSEVFELLKVIVPDLSLSADRLELVDEIVHEMVKVNKEQTVTQSDS